MNTNERCTAPVSREKGQIRQIRSASYMVPIYWQCPDHAVLALIRPDNVRMRGGVSVRRHDNPAPIPFKGSSTHRCSSRGKYSVDFK